jgi:hypothetical protein
MQPTLFFKGRVTGVTSLPDPFREIAMSQDWERVERELAEAMPGIAPSIDQLDFLPDNNSMRVLRCRPLQATDALLEHIAKALEDGRIEALAD